MSDRHWSAVAFVAAVVTALTVVVGVVAPGTSTSTAAAVVAPSTTSSTAAPTTTSTTAATTTTAAPSTTPTTVDDGSLHVGTEGPAVQALQQRLIDLRYDPGPADGKFGAATQMAVWAFEKLNGMPPDGRVGPDVQAKLANPAPIASIAPGGEPDRTEIDLARQVLVLYLGGSVRLITHVSTGGGYRYCDDDGRNCRKAITPVGAFRYTWRSSGWVEAPLGKLYNPVYFTSDGIAVHGSLSVPTSPASHGCVRIPMQIAEYFPSLVPRGQAVYVSDGSPVAVTPPPVSSGPKPEDRPTTPGDDPPPSSTTTTTTTTTTQPTTPTTLLP